MKYKRSNRALSLYLQSHCIVFLIFKKLGFFCGPDVGECPCYCTHVEVRGQVCGARSPPPHMGCPDCTVRASLRLLGISLALHSGFLMVSFYSLVSRWHIFHDKRKANSMIRAECRSIYSKEEWRDKEERRDQFTPPALPRWDPWRLHIYPRLRLTENGSIPFLLWCV